MNNIYKVIWSKAKNCYVVASEIARSHTKSASGSEKIGGVARHALLALGAACAIACGGFVNVGAYTAVDVSTPSAGVAKVYDADTVDLMLREKADKSNTFTKEQTYTQAQVKKLINDLKIGDVATNRDNITTNKDNITTLVGKTVGLSNDGKSLNGMNSVETGALTVTGQISDGANVNTTLADIKGSMTQTETNAKAIDTLQKTTAGQADAIKDLKDRTTNISYDSGKRSTSINGIDIGDTQVDMNGKNLTDVGTINGIDLGTKQKGNYISQDGSIWGNMLEVDDQVKTNADAIAKETADRKAAIGELAVDGKYIKKGMNVSDNLVELDKQAKINADNIQTNANNIKNNKDEIARVNGELVKTNNHFNTELRKTNDYFNTELGKTNNHFNTELGKTNAALQEEGKVRANADAALANDITETNKRTAGIERTDTGVAADKQTVIEGKVRFDQNGNVSGVKDLKTDTIHATGEITSEGLDAGSGEIQTKGKVSAGDVSTGTLETTGNAKIGGDLTVNGKLNVGEIYMEHHKQESTGEKYDSATSITADGISNNAKVTDRNGVKTESTFTHDKEGSTTYAYQGDAANWKKSTSNVTADGVENVAEDSKGNNNTFTQTSTDTKNILKDKDGNTSTTRQDSKGIYGYAKDKDGNKSYTKQEGNRIAESVIGQDGKQTKSEMTSTDITNTAKDGTITNDAKDIVNNATGDMTNNVGGNLSTTVGGNEIHEVKGTKTETVEGKLTENFKGGQETNVTGDQTINVSGTQTTTATDINRNASSSMVDKVDNAYGTNTETKEAGKTTTDVSIKGTGEKGKYIRGANESRDYLIKDTLMNSETKTAEATSTEITDGTNKASTRQDAKNLAGSVTNGTEIGVSGIHANDDGSVSIDSAVAGGGMSSVINQKKDSIQSAVGDGTNSTVIHQDKDNVTIASSNGTVAIVGKDIVNNASENITTTAKTMDTTVTGKATESYGELDTTVNGMEKHTVNGNQDIHVTKNQTNKIDGNQENTIGGDQTTNVTGNISNKAKNITNEATDTLTDKVGDNTRVINGEGITDTVGGSNLKSIVTQKKGSIETVVTDGTSFNHSRDIPVASTKTLTGYGKMNQLLDDLNSSTKTITDGTHKTSKVQTALDITNTAADGTITNDAKNIVNNAKDTITNTAGTSITNQVKDSKVTTDANGTTFENNTAAVSDGGATTTQINGNQITTGRVNANELAVSDKDGDNTADLSVKAGEDGGVKASAGNGTTTGSLDVKADKVTTSIKSGAKENTVTSTADGTIFSNSEAAAPVTGASGAGTAVNTTIKGNTINTGKVTMDYAEVMKDLGVGGNANIAGTTTTKTLKVTEDASVDRDLSVGGNATITGDVTANSYKVGRNTYIDENGINANNQKITNVADGSISEGSKDAVNGGQLYGVKRDLEHQVDKVGANAAAMANLRPMEFDPSSKWNIAAAIGNYGSETAAAIGAFYRPNDNVMVNLSTAFGTGENMVGGGVSVRLGKGGNKLSREETNALKAQVADLSARMDALLSVLNPNMSKDFPDVPENHWAYEAVSRLAGNDIVQGYPDGEFHGERTMTRYEMAEIIYNALSRGAEAERELVEEFKPELQAMAASEKSTAEKAEG